MSLRVGVLGPVAAWSGGQELPVGQPRQQAVLGILAMRANRVISRDELVDGLWGSDPPVSAEGGIYTYVAGLRRIFEPGRSLRGPGRVLVSVGGGYRLHLAPDQPDAAAFEQNLIRARRLRHGGDLGGAAAALEAGLGLWRGAAFAGVPGPFAETERARLAELRWSAAEERADVLLALGRHADAVPDLTALVAEHPLRERMRGLLMIALYRSGRPAEALHAFGEGRRVLAEELGIDPGADLSRIRQQVLTTDPGLDVRAATSGTPAAAVPPAGAVRHAALALRHADHASAGVPVPAQLPLDSHGFAGRADQLRLLHEMLPPERATAGQSVPIAVISGTAGVGKTALAIRFGRQVVGRFPGGQLFLNLRGCDPVSPALEPAEALRLFLDAFGVPPHRIPAGTQARAALYRSLADGKQMLIVLDNASTAAQVRPLLPGSPGCAVLVTSRNEMTGLVAAEGAVPVPLDVLSPAEAAEMLGRRLGRDRAAAEPEAAGEIIESCAGLPLALSIAAARAVARPRRLLGELAAELRDAGGRLDALRADDAETDAQVVLSWSYHQLSVPAARMFRLLGVHPGPDIALPAAASLAGMPRTGAVAALSELVRTHMVAEHLPARFTFHGLLRAYAAGQAERYDSAEHRREAVHRVLDHYLHTATAAAMRFSPDPVPPRLAGPLPGVFPADFPAREEAVAWFDAEAPVLLALTAHAAATGFDVHAWQLPWALSPFFARRGRLADFAATAQTALAAARRLGDTQARAHAHHLLGHAQQMLGNYGQAELNARHALEEFRELGDPAGEAAATGGLAVTMEEQGRYPEALALALDGLRMLRAAGHWSTQSALENTAGRVHAHLGRYDEALSHCQRALGMHRDCGNRGGAADALDSLGLIYRYLGDHARSAAHFTQAAAIYHEIGDVFNQGRAMAGLGETHADEGNLTAAREALQSAAALLDNAPHPRVGEIRAKAADLGPVDPGRLDGAATVVRSV
ncbi:MAG: tetratricopeptide repeat protein [Streptosporangiaceae bacterium]|nr:tetratricopeptide repeat protein [Streptosporangiaceae bacterium]